MKHMMKLSPRKIFCTLTAALLCLWLCVPAMAGADTDDPCVQWSMSQDKTTLTGDNVTYTLYELPPEYHISGLSEYNYVNSAQQGGRRYSISTTTAGCGVVVASWSSSQLLFVNSRGYDALEALVHGRITTWVLSDSGYVRYSMTDDLHTELNHATADRETDVSRLRGQLMYEIYGYDETGTVYTVAGAIYLLDGAYLYIDYLSLGNQYFDADGNFSYRSGTVTAACLSGDVKTQLEQLPRVTYTVTYEGGIGDGDDAVDNSGRAVGAFMVCFVLIGFLLPIAPLVVGLVMPRSAKRGYPKRWYIVTGLAALWMLLALVILMLLL